MFFFYREKCKNNENKSEKIKLIAAIASQLNCTYCVQISERSDEKNAKVATAPSNTM